MPENKLEGVHRRTIKEHGGKQNRRYTGSCMHSAKKSNDFGAIGPF